MLKLTDLALRPDFQLGPMLVSPSRRLVEGPGGRVTVEPLIMQVLLLLLDAAGKVVTRNQLFDECWGGVYVGDDSLNRAIAKIRRTGEQVAPGLLEIETIPRTGYRLTGKVLANNAQHGSDKPEERGLSRRVVLASAGAFGVAAAGGFALWSFRTREDREFNDLMARGEEALDSADPATKPTQYFRRAVSIRPDDARAQGLFAFSQAVRAEFGEAGAGGAALEEAEQAARAALAINPNEPNARLAQTIIQRATLDFAANEDRLREILATDPDNILAMRTLWGLLVSVGRSRDALALVERALAVKPLAAGNHYPRAQLLWILGRTAEADRVIDRAMQYWPSHRFVRYARFTIFAYAGRPRAALAMLEKPETAPQNFSPAMISLWRVTLAAFDRQSPASIAAARRANIDASKRDLTLTTQAVQALSMLGDVDSAFDVANDVLVFRRSSGLRSQSASNRPPVKSTAWRFAPWLFTPPTAAMRADPRFKAICDEIGLTEYWAKRGIRPDYQLGIT